MSKTIMQYRFYEKENPHNQPSDINIIDLAMGTTFLSDDIKTNYGLITSIGIQTLPGTKLSINQNIDPVIVGHSGIFELDLTGKSSIYKLAFGIKSLEKIASAENGHLIVDVVYDTEV